MQIGQTVQNTVIFPKCLTKNCRADCIFDALIGWKDPGGKVISVVNLICSTDSSTTFASWKEELESCLPAGYDVVGLWKPNVEIMHDDISEWAKQIGFSADAGQFVVITGDLKSMKVFLAKNDGNGWALISNIQIVFCDSLADYKIRKGSISLRLKTAVFLEIQVPNETGDIRNELINSFEKLENRFIVDTSVSEEVQNGSAKVIFKAKNNGFLLESCRDQGGFTNSGFSDGQCSLFELWKVFHPDEKNVKIKELFYTQDCIDFVLLEDVTLKPVENGTKCTRHVPVIHHEATEFISYSVKLCLEAVAICSQNTKVRDLHELLCQALVRQVRCARRCMETYSDFQECKLIAPEPFLFNVDSIGHPLLLFYPNNVTDEKLEKRRFEICLTWNLPTDVPCIRRVNRFFYPFEQGAYLWTVHRFAHPSGILGGICATVAGNYEYRHYMQDNFNDVGWGCAYRSFQTIWSWFMLQGYTEKSVPGHREIQQALVDIGDRPEKFVGSKQWIGSLELSYCLSHLLNIESKILNISSGSELLSKVREIISHFQIEGTPVMIGGGVLAHTILGVHYCEESGDVKFLVLDPHYTSEENIKSIVDKGWCGWKPSTFWSSEVFYNLLLPQRPKKFL